MTSLEVTVCTNTRDGEPICQWAEHHKREHAIQQSWSGTPTADMFARQWGETLTWTAYAPILDTAGQTVCLLALEYPSQLIATYPEWNRMGSSWNGLLEPVE